VGGFRASVHLRSELKSCNSLWLKMSVKISSSGRIHISRRAVHAPPSRQSRPRVRKSQLHQSGNFRLYFLVHKSSCGSLYLNRSLSSSIMSLAVCRMQTSVAFVNYAQHIVPQVRCSGVLRVLRQVELVPHITYHTLICPARYSEIIQKGQSFSGPWRLFDFHYCYQVRHIFVAHLPSRTL
jgi:hypothetical protein